MIFDKINELIPMLNAEDDLLLIQMLEQKKQCIKKVMQTNTYNVHISANQFRFAKESLQRILNDYLLHEHPSSKLIDKMRCVIENKCYKCKHSVGWKVGNSKTHTHTVQYYDKNNNTCKSCQRRTNILQDKIDNFNEMIHNSINSILTDDIINLKSIILILQKKLYDKKEHRKNHHLT